jgi:hypothetical protein
MYNSALQASKISSPTLVDPNRIIATIDNKEKSKVDARTLEMTADKEDENAKSIVITFDEQVPSVADDLEEISLGDSRSEKGEDDLKQRKASKKPEKVPLL